MNYSLTKKQAKELNTDYRLLEKGKHPVGWLIMGVIGLIITFPVFIFGNIFNLTFLQIPNSQIPRIRDPQFHSSIRYAISLVLAIIILPIYLILSIIIFQPWWWLGTIVFISLPLTGLFAWNYSLQLRRIFGGFRIKNYIRNNNKEFNLLRKNYTEVVKLVAAL